jgi:hypothetical protein
MSTQPEDPGPISNNRVRVTRETAERLIAAISDLGESASKLSKELAFLQDHPVAIQGHLGAIRDANSVRVYLSRLNSMISENKRQIERSK